MSDALTAEEAKHHTDNLVKAMRLGIDIVDCVEKNRGNFTQVDGMEGLPTEPFLEIIKAAIGHEPSGKDFILMNVKLIELLSRYPDGSVGLCDMFDFGHSMWHIFWPHA